MLALVAWMSRCTPRDLLNRRQFLDSYSTCQARENLLPKISPLMTLITLITLIKLIS
jgi:hypothetical protein